MLLCLQHVKPGAAIRPLQVLRMISLHGSIVLHLAGHTLHEWAQHRPCPVLNSTIPK